MNLLDFIFPKRCVGCGRFGRYFCGECRLKMKPILSNEPICPVCEKPAIDGFTHPRCVTRYAPDGLTAFFHYDGPVRRAIKAIKYRYISDLAKEFVSLVPQLTDSQFSIHYSRFILIPIPLHSSRFRQRGFNQSEVLAQYIARSLNIPVRTDILLRTKQTTPQVHMKDRKTRLTNMKNVFSIRKSTFLNHQSVLLFDDVFTTGATMRAAAATLKRAGVKHVWAITMAR